MSKTTEGNENQTISQDGNHLDAVGRRQTEVVDDAIVTASPDLLHIMAGIAAGMQSVVRAAREYLSRADVQASLAKLTKDVTRAISQLPDRAQLEVGMARIHRLPQDLRAVFLAAGFPPAVRLTMPEVARIQQDYERGDIEACKAYIEERCTSLITDAEERGSLLASWSSNPLLARRIDILREAVTAASQGLYAVAVPTLLSQLEGVIADGSNHTGYMGSPAYKNHVKDLADRDILFGSILRDYVSSALLTQFLHGTSPNSELSRHAILHGGDVRYGTRLNTTKAIMLLDYVQAVFAENSPPAPAEPG